MIQEMPKEVVLQIFKFMNDFEIQIMLKVSLKTRRLAQDYNLWKYIYTDRNPKKLTKELGKTTRPNRIDLINQNILKSFSPKVVSSTVSNGGYINDLFHYNSWKLNSDLSKKIRSQIILNFFENRPKITLLKERNILPVMKFTKVKVSSNLEPIVYQIFFSDISKQTKKAVLERLPSIKERIQFFSLSCKI